LKPGPNPNRQRPSSGGPALSDAGPVRSLPQLRLPHCLPSRGLPPRAGPSLPLARSDGLLPQPRRPALASPARSVPDRPGPLVSSSARSRGRSRSLFPLSPTRRPHMAAPSPPRSNNRARSAEIPGGPSIRGTTPQDHRSRFINGAPHPLNPSLPSQVSPRS